MTHVAVFGIGNVLFTDDGVGPYVITQLDALWKFPEGVVVEDLGTPDLGFAGRLIGYDAIVLIDAVSSDDPPGTVRVFRKDEILAHPPGLRISPHDPTLKETLLTADFAGNGPSDITLVGVVPASTEGAAGLSDTVRDAVPFVIEAVLGELNRLGIYPRPKTVAQTVRVWWEPAAKA